MLLCEQITLLVPALSCGFITIGAASRIKFPRPAAFEDCKVKTLLEEFEKFTDLVGIRTDRGKLTAFRALPKNRALTILKVARRIPEKIDSVAAKDTLVSNLDISADHQEAFRFFRTTQPRVDVDPYSMS
ncbi:unnamed protein product [Echinostoma caproni]|uniref:Uncharacterized protein n=1 Tax=Echinostoma caproni TaxID=27848 RepID=A0A183B3R6_9TREM|nr:unnamed protein product [Echinostoma caproni]